MGNATGILPLKAGYGPSAPQLLAARWLRMGVRGRRLSVAVLAVAGAALIAFLLLTFGGARTTGGRLTRFSFARGSLGPAPPEAGALASAQSADRRGLLARFSVAPLSLPAYAGSSSGELPLAAEALRATLSRRFGGFHLIGEGPVRTNAYGSWEELPPSTIYYHVPTYALAFTARSAAEPIEGRAIMLLRSGGSARAGLVITMLQRRRNGNMARPLSLGTTGVLSRALRSFAIGER